MPELRPPPPCVRAIGRRRGRCNPAIRPIPVRFADDSPVEGDGFEPSVPRQKDNAFRDSSFPTLTTRGASTSSSRDQSQLTGIRIDLNLGDMTAGGKGEIHRIEEGGLFQAAMIEEVRFAEDSLVEGDGFEPSVPLREKPTSSPVGTRSPEPPRGGDGTSAPTGKGLYSYTPAGGGIAVGRRPPQTFSISSICAPSGAATQHTCRPLLTRSSRICALFFLKFARAPA
jgi:hypothetical protein